MSMAGGVMRMRQAATGLAIAPRATLTLAPGGDHLMLVAPKPGLKIGDHVPVTLRFAHAGAVKTEFIVRADAPASPVMAMPGMPSR
jgi:copper(I)-binding protein